MAVLLLDEEDCVMRIQPPPQSPAFVVTLLDVGVIWYAKPGHVLALLCQSIRYFPIYVPSSLRVCANEYILAKGNYASYASKNNGGYKGSS
jgi:hypothetical protein